MQHPFQYVLVRYVPRVDRGEFVNVGVIVHSQSAGVLRALTHLDEERVRAFDPEVDLTALYAALAALETGCDARATDRSDELTSLGKRFGWFAAPRSTVVQPGPVHGGSSADPAAAADELLDRLVRLR